VKGSSPPTASATRTSSRTSLVARGSPGARMGRRRRRSHGRVTWRRRRRVRGLGRRASRSHEIPAVDPGAPRARRVHVGHHVGPEGCPCTRTGRSPPRSNSSRHAAIAAGRDDPGAPVGMASACGGAVGAGLQTAPRSTLSTCGTGSVLAAMLGDGLSAGQGSTFFLTSLLDASRLQAGAARTAHAVRRARWCGGPGRGRERCAAMGSRSRGASARPSIRRSRGPHPRRRHDKRVTTMEGRYRRVEIRLVDDDRQRRRGRLPGEIWSRGPDLFIGYTDALGDRGGIQADGGHDRRHRRPRRRRLPDDHGPQRRTSSAAARTSAHRRSKSSWCGCNM